MILSIYLSGNLRPSLTWFYFECN